MEYNYRNPIYNQNGGIDCEVEHPEYGWIPFTASPDDVEESGRLLFDKIKKKGKIADYIPPSIEVFESEVRSRRDYLLKETDWTQLPDVPEETKLVWAEYRQALRDITEQSGFPYDIVWPEKP
jgi:hypothetical protein